MSRGDLLIERAADRLEQLARESAQSDGFRAKLAEELAEDAIFLRKLKPSLIAARARGERPHNGRVTPTASPPPAAEARSEPVPEPKPAPKRQRKPPKSGGPNPFVVIGAAFVMGVGLAKWIDWRGHAHPRV